MHEHTVHLPSGRRLQVLEDGSRTGIPIFTLHGTPGSRLLAPAFVADAKAHGIRLIGYDRPGYGLSTAHPGRTVADVASDVGSIADALGIRRFAVWGHSGGGAPALACAALMPTRVVAATSLAGVAPFDADGLQWTDGMGAQNVEDTELALHDREAWMAKGRAEREAIMGMSGADLMTAWSTLFSEVDREFCTPLLQNFLIAQVHEGLRPGIDGMVHDNLSEFGPWGFDLASIQVPVQVWHGRMDRFVPFAHGEWLSRHVPHAENHLEAQEGHVSLLGRVPDVHRWLAAKFDG